MDCLGSLQHAQPVPPDYPAEYDFDRDPCRSLLRGHSRRDSTDAGVIEEAEQDIMERVFRLGDRRAGTLMTPRSEIAWLDIDDAPVEIQ